jgi:metal-dependent amidase/aminoacylase/carboxypeptidase family protein
MEDGVPRSRRAEIAVPRTSMMTLDDLVSIRRDLHAYPELAFEETRTASVVAARLRALGLTVREQVGRTGVVADLGREGAGPNLIVRAEMDALPVSEPEGGAFRSTIPGVMHACGHDAHMAILLGVAAELSRRSEPFPGLTRFVFQPAEEIGAGAQAMIDDGALDGARWDAILAVHLRPFLPVGEIGICRGSAMAKVGEFQVDVRDRRARRSAARFHRCAAHRGRNRGGAPDADSSRGFRARSGGPLGVQHPRRFCSERDAGGGNVRGNRASGIRRGVRTVVRAHRGRVGRHG